MLIRYVWHGIDVEPITCESTDVPRREESVVLTFAKGEPDHSFRVLWVRWHPQADPPWVHIQVASR